MHKNPVVWFEIYVADMQRAKKFYESVFQLELKPMGDPNSDPDMEMWAFPSNYETSGTSGTICKMKGMSPGNNSVIVYFSCDDCAKEESRAQKFGGKVQTPKMSIGEFGFISLVHDSEGNLIGLHSMA